MLVYPYTYSFIYQKKRQCKEEAMQRRVDLFDRVVAKGLVLAVFWSVWSLIPTTSDQMEDLQSNGNIGLDTRPSMQLTLRLRGPKNSNL